MMASTLPVTELPNVAVHHYAPTVLIVDDDRVMRELMVKVLTRGGYDVLSAASGDEARRTAAEQTIDVLISDVAAGSVRPDGTIATMMAEQPAMGHLRISTSTDALRPFPFAGQRTIVLRKPFSSAMLVDSVRAMLGAVDI